MSKTLQLGRELTYDMASLTYIGFFGPVRIAVDRWRFALRQVARPAGAGPWPAGYHNRRQQLLASKLKRKFLCRHSTETSTSTAAAAATAMPLALLFLLPVSFLFYSAKLCPEFDFHVAQSRQRLLLLLLLRAKERGARDIPLQLHWLLLEKVATGDAKGRWEGAAQLEAASERARSICCNVTNLQHGGKLLARPTVKSGSTGWQTGGKGGQRV